MLINLLFLFSIVTNAKDISVMMIDTGVSLSHPEIASHMVQDDPLDFIVLHDHGNHIAGIILKDTCKEVKLHSCNYYHHTKYKSTSDFSNECFKRALDLKVDYINYSSGGKEFLAEEKELIQKLLKRGVKIVVAAGNDGLNRPNYYPAKYELLGLIVVGNLDKNGLRHYTSNYGFKDMVWEIGTDIVSTLPNGTGMMTGTSQSTAVKMNKLLKEACDNNLRH